MTVLQSFTNVLIETVTRMQSPHGCTCTYMYACMCCVKTLIISKHPYSFSISILPRDEIGYGVVNLCAALINCS